MIATGHRLSADAGAQALADGGNAIDAAAAAVFASWVVEPEMCGIGGTAQGVLHLAASGETVALYPARGVPAAAAEDMFELEPGLDPWGRWRKVKDDANMFGPRSIATPGALAGMSAVLDAYGSLPLARLLEPAIAHARDGFSVDGYTALTIGSHLDEILRYPPTAEIFAPGGVPPSPGSAHQAGSTIVQSDLARSLRRIAHEGAAVFHGGELARSGRAIPRVDRRDSHRSGSSRPAGARRFPGTTIHLPRIRPRLERRLLRSADAQHPRELRSGVARPR